MSREHWITEVENKELEHDQAIKIDKLHDALHRIYLFGGSGIQYDVRTIRSLLKELGL